VQNIDLQMMMMMNSFVLVVIDDALQSTTHR